MKTPGSKKLDLISLFSAWCFLLTLSGCGLDVYPYLESPYNVINQPEYNSEYTQNSFKFFTNENSNWAEYGKESDGSAKSEFIFLGTDVYYKIYNNSTTLVNECNAINGVITSDNPAGIAEKLTDSYKYQPLKIADTTRVPLIPSTGTAQSVEIRLSTYGSDSLWQSTIKINGNEIGKPLRCFDNLTFEFGRHDDDTEHNLVPAQTDEDVKYSSSFSDTNKSVWYVSMYAVAIGRDSNYSNFYSNLLWLGSVPIDASSYNN